MNKNDFKEFCLIMYGTAENFSANLSKDGLKIRFEALREYPIEKIKDAAMQIIRTRKYTSMPTVADFLTAIEGDQEHADEDRAEMEATKVLEKIRAIGSYGTPRFDDPVTSEIVKRRFGWGNLCQMKIDQTSFFIRDFKAAYMAYNREKKRRRLELSVGGDLDLKKLTESITQAI